MQEVHEGLEICLLYHTLDGIDRTEDPINRTNAPIVVIKKKRTGHNQMSEPVVEGSRDSNHNGMLNESNNSRFLQQHEKDKNQGV